MKRGDLVFIKGCAMVGKVIRVARDRSWIDVHWGGWSKRQRKPEVLTLVQDGTSSDLNRIMKRVERIERNR